jgi:NSS family neurotransmitter:Na+ symporter
MFDLKRRLSTIGRVQWSSERGFVLATAAAAVGLGNIWRFPYVAGENGGGSFVIAYILSVLILGVPLMVLEISAGRSEYGSPVKTFRSLNRKAAGFGWFVVILTLIIMSYYLAITGWTLAFAVESYTGSITSFAEFTDGYSSIIYFVIVMLTTAIVVTRGIKAIELLSKVLMPLLFLIVVFLAVYSLSLDKAGEALSFLFRPEWSGFFDIRMWFLAFGQAFYSLAVGQGYLITYGSFLSREVSLPRATGIVASTETVIALLAGIIIFPIVFSFGMNPEQGTQLAFTTLPVIFNSVAFGGVLAMFFFSLFFLAAISSCIAGMQVVKTAFREEFGLSHPKAALYSFLPVAPLGFLSALSFTPIGFSLFGRPFLEILDLFAANQIVVASGIIGGAIISWSFSKTDLVESIGTTWRKTAGIAITVFRVLPFLAALVLFLSWFLNV